MKNKIFFSLLILAGCTPKADTTLMIQTPYESSRIQIVRIGVIEDNLAYNNRRGIYLIKDSVTGKEYVGLSGIGISELGSHSQSDGKHTSSVSDER